MTLHSGFVVSRLRLGSDGSAPSEIDTTPASTPRETDHTITSGEARTDDEGELNDQEVASASLSKLSASPQTSPQITDGCGQSAEHAAYSSGEGNLNSELYVDDDNADYLGESAGQVVDDQFEGLFDNESDEPMNVAKQGENGGVVDECDLGEFGSVTEGYDNVDLKDGGLKVDEADIDYTGKENQGTSNGFHAIEMIY